MERGRRELTAKCLFSCCYSSLYLVRFSTHGNTLVAHIKDDSRPLSFFILFRLSLFYWFVHLSLYLAQLVHVARVMFDLWPLDFLSFGNTIAMQSSRKLMYTKNKTQEKINLAQLVNMGTLWFHGLWENVQHFCERFAFHNFT